MTDSRRLTIWVLGGVLAVLIVGTVVVTRIVPFLRRDSVELCGRDFHRSDATLDEQQVQALGSIHRIGTSRIGEALWTVSSAWPQGRCSGVTPTVLLSRDGRRWATWALAGGP
jgi:hypothetical protein